MQCPYCGAPNSVSAQACVACNKQLPHTGFMRKLDMRTPRNYPALFHLRFSTRFIAEQYWRTRHLTGFTSPNPRSGPQVNTAKTGRTSVDPDLTLNSRPFHAAGQAARQPVEKPPEPERHGKAATSSVAPECGSNFNAASKRVLSRVFMMTSVFVIGALVGVSTAWWMHRDAGTAQGAASSRPAQAAVKPVPEQLQQERRVPLKGISPGELPYDGVPPSAVDSGQQIPEMPAVVTSQDEVEAGVLSSGDGMPASDHTQQAATAPPEPPLENEMREAEENVIEPKPAIPVAAQKPPAKSTGQAKRKANGGDAKEPARRHGTSKLAKDREIERIKQQADQELQRKLELSRAVEAKRARKQQAARNNPRQETAMRESRETRVRRVLAKCERNPNFFRREQCKWRLCAGMWGKNGCPSYPRQASTY